MTALIIEDLFCHEFHEFTLIVTKNKFLIRVN